MLWILSALFALSKELSVKSLFSGLPIRGRGLVGGLYVIKVCCSFGSLVFVGCFVSSCERSVQKLDSAACSLSAPGVRCSHPCSHVDSCMSLGLCSQSPDTKVLWCCLDRVCPSAPLHGIAWRQGLSLNCLLFLLGLFACEFSGSACLCPLSHAAVIGMRDHAHIFELRCCQLQNNCAFPH